MKKYKFDIKSILPKTIDNEYRGNKIALYVFYLITIITLGRSLIHVFAPDGGALSIATIPLDTFSSNAAAAVITMFALWGLSQIIVGLIYIIIGFRYRSLVPLMYLLIVFEYLARTLILKAKPFEIVGTAPGGVMNVPATILAIVFLILSLLQCINSKNE